MLDKIINTKHYFSTYTYTTDIELLNVVINIFSSVVLKNSLTSREKLVLRSYLKNGYSTTTKESIRSDLKISSKNLDQINLNLSVKGFLLKHPTNYRLKVINQELIDLRDSFIGTEKGLYIIGFQKKLIK